MELKGTAIKIGDDINTDLIISGRYKFSITDMSELSKHILEDSDPSFAKKIVVGTSMIVAGKNFGMGSSREQAPLVIKAAGISCVLASSFARIFFRNAFNVGLPLIETDTAQISEGDALTINFDTGTIRNTTRNKELSATVFPAFMQAILAEGGIVNYIRKHGELKV